MLPTHPLTLQYADVKAAKSALFEVVAAFNLYYLSNADVKHMHPLFGRLGGKDWERVHYKHCFHHLLQFGLIFQELDIRT